MVEEAWEAHGRYYGRKNPEMEFSCKIECEVSPATIFNRHYDADVIVSRGGTAMGLKSGNYLTPVVEIPITSKDLDSSIATAIGEYGMRRVGFVGTDNMVYNLRYITPRPNLSAKIYRIPSVDKEDLIDGVERAVADGAEIIIGGSNTNRYCQERGICASLLQSSVESIFQSITEAKRCAMVSYVERRNSTLFRAVLDHSFEGIIVFDENQRIRVFNPTAASMLGRNGADCIGKTAEQALPPSPMNAILYSNRHYTNEIVRINGEPFVLNSVPMTDAGENIGMLITFQGTQTIVDAESRIRDRIYAHGHFARYHFSDILGDSSAMQRAVHQAKRFAAVDTNILLYGETGTGKELFAQSMHNESARADKPFVAVNCAAMPESLMESEFFGYVSGAFTGANKAGKVGLFEMAHRGTIFLDEISEIPLNLQSRLLRVIQEREIMRLGGDRVIPVDMRIICATNRDLLQMIREGKFRDDLYYRLKVLSIELPPLRERGEDILRNMRHFLNHYTDKFGKARITLSPEAARLAMSYDWPGNLRELRNVSEQLAVLHESEQITGAEMLAVLPMKSQAPVVAAPAAREAPPVPDKTAALRDVEREQIQSVLARAHSRKEAAQTLGISKTTLWRKAKEYGLL